jgi:hypothetical protein
MSKTPLMLCLVLFLPAGCDDSTPATLDSAVTADKGPSQNDGQQPTPDGTPDGMPDGPVDGAPQVPDGKLSPDLGVACASEIAALQKEIYKTPAQSCTAVVRLDHDTLALKGFELICGKYAKVTEAQARATAYTDSGYGQGGKMVNAANPADEYVFYEAPGDFGGCASVSARTGLTVFGASIIWMGTGKITYPKTWRAASQLGSNCPAAGGIPKSQGYDLVQGGALQKADVDKAVAVVLKTAVPAAFWKGGYVFDAVVLRYPRSVGAFDPTTAEWIVLVNGGWLE